MKKLLMQFNVDKVDTELNDYLKELNGKKIEISDVLAKKLSPNYANFDSTSFEGVCWYKGEAELLQEISNELSGSVLIGFGDASEFSIVLFLVVAGEEFCVECEVELVEQ